MKLYPKQLRNLEDLRREKHALRYAEKHIKKEGFFSVGSKAAGGPANASIINTIISLLTSQSAIKTIITLATTFTGFKKGKKSKKNSNHFFKKLAKELIGGYVKWKAIEVTYRWLRRSLVSKDKKEHDD